MKSPNPYLRESAVKFLIKEMFFFENRRLSILPMAETYPDGHEGGQILARSDDLGSLDSEGLY